MDHPRRSAGTDGGGEGAALYRHVVMFQFKESSGAEDIERIEQAFVALGKTLDLVKEFEWGTNVSPEGLSDGLTHCFLVTFASAADLEAYLPHPRHQAFVELLKPHLEKATVIDYVAR